MQLEENFNLVRHYKFISAKNIIVFVSSDDLHALYVSSVI